MESGELSINEKAAIKSKTILFNFISGVVVLWPLVAPYFGFNLNLTPEQISVAASAICAANIWLRKISKEAIYWIKSNV